jgi:signal transduction histidine kinase
MHDVLAHRISLLSLHAGALEFRPGASSEEVAPAAAVIRQNAHQALEDLRKVIWILRESPAAGDPQPPQPTLAELPALIADSQQAGVRVSFENRLGDLAVVPTAVGRDAYRTLQEALTNARKHAPGCAVELFAGGGPGSGLTIEVRNPLPLGGRPVTAVPGTGTGIVGLVERATLAGGRLEYGPTAEGDYRLWAWFPWTP